jgi:hypothetical protein
MSYVLFIILSLSWVEHPGVSFPYNPEARNVGEEDFGFIEILFLLAGGCGTLYFLVQFLS